MHIPSTGNHSHIQAYSQTRAANSTKTEPGTKSAEPQTHMAVEPKDTVSISEETKSKSANAAEHIGDISLATAKTYSTTAASASAESKTPVFDKLKATFADINFVTGRDPFAAKDAKNNGHNTVYLDADALRKIENDPRYAARVFANIESSKEVFGKGYYYTDGGRTATLVGGALNLSFYGKGEGCKSLASMYIYSATGSMGNNQFLYGESPGKALHRGINDLYNRDLKKWYDAFNVHESERFYYDFNEAWSKLQAAQKGIQL